MVEFIEPLNLEKILVNVFSGTPEIFLGVALMVIVGMAAYFRMNNLTLLLMVGIFLLMFTPFITSPIIILMMVIGGLLVGMLLAKTFSQ